MSPARARRARPRALLALWAAMRGRRQPGAPSATTSLRTLPRLAAAVATGRYHGTSGRQLALMALALLYVVSPVDAVPELAFLGAGLVDDGIVLAWLAGALLTETDAFLAWEREQRTGAGAAGGTRGPAGPGRSRPTGGPTGDQGRAGRPEQPEQPDVVVGEVIR